MEHMTNSTIRNLSTQNMEYVLVFVIVKAITKKRMEWEENKINKIRTSTLKYWINHI